MIEITLDEIERFAPRPVKAGTRRDTWNGYVAAITSPEGAALLARYNITTERRWQHLAATWATETGGLQILWESGAYSAEGILRVFGAGRHSARVTPTEAARLAGDGPALFERVYGLGNPRKARELGNTRPGDGWRFRGLGPNQITGRGTHEECAAVIGCTLDELAQPLNALHAALLEWGAKDCNRFADADDVVAVRKLINGGSLKVPASRLNGLEDAKSWLRRARRVWPDETKAAPEPKAVAAPVTERELAKVSRKVALALQVRNAAAAVLTAIGGLFSLDTFGVAKGAIDDARALAADNALILGIALAFLAVTAGQYVLRLSINAYREGRYVPSGESET